MTKTQKLQSQALALEVLKDSAIDRLTKDAIALSEIQSELSFVVKKMLLSLNENRGGLK